MAEIAAVADVYDALTSERPYREEIPSEQVGHLLASMAGTHLNQEIVEHLLTMLPVFPLGANIRVTAGQHEGYRGVVVKETPWNLSSPTIRLIFNALGDRISPVEIDLDETPTPIRAVPTGVVEALKGP